MSYAEAESSPQAYHRPRDREPREPRQREIDFSPVGGIVPIAILAGVAYLGYTYKDKIFEIFKNLESDIQGKIKDLPPITLPSIGGSTTTADDNPTPGPVGSNTGSSTLGSVSSTGQWYKANGPTAAMPNARCSSGKCGTSSGGNSGGNRWENNMKGWMAHGFEVVVYFQIPQGAMCSGGHIGLKHGGPNHTSPCDYSFSGSCCCWWDTGVDNNAGKAYVEIERPHPHNSGRKYYASVGTRLDSGKPIGMRWHISREGAGFRLIHWIDTSGTAGAYQWKETYNVLDTGQFMPTDYYSHITNTQNIEIRISDVACKDIKMVQAPVSRQITSSAAYARAYPVVLDEMRPLYNPRISMA